MIGGLRVRSATPASRSSSTESKHDRSDRRSAITPAPDDVGGRRISRHQTDQSDTPVSDKFAKLSGWAENDSAHRSVESTRAWHDSQLERYLAKEGLDVSKIQALVAQDQHAKRTGVEKEFFILCHDFQTGQERVERAKFFVQQAMRGERVKTRRLGVWPVRVFHLERSRLFNRLMMLVTFYFLLLSFWEVPSVAQSWVRFNAGEEFKSPLWVLISEGFVIGIFLLQFALFAFHSWGHVFSTIIDNKVMINYAEVFNLLLNVLILLDFLVHVIASEPIIRFARPLRVLKLTYFSRSIRAVFFALLTCAPILDVIILTSVFILTFVGIGMTLFEGMSTEVGANFNSFGESVASLYVASTGDNFPALSEPIIAVNSANMFFFIVFITIIVMMIFPIPLAFILDSYKKNRRDQILEKRVVQKKALISAFICLDCNGDGVLDLSEWEELLRALSTDATQVRQCFSLFEILDTDNSGTLDIIEWFHREYYRTVSGLRVM